MIRVNEKAVLPPNMEGTVAAIQKMTDVLPAKLIA